MGAAVVQLRPQTHHPDQPAASGSHRLPNALGQVGEQYGPSIAPFARARCPFSPLLRPHFPGGAARGSHAGQFSCFGPRSCFIAFVLDIPNGVWPLNGAVGRAYLRETVPTWGLAFGVWRFGLVWVSPQRALGAPSPRYTWRRPRYAQKIWSGPVLPPPKFPGVAMESCLL